MATFETLYTDFDMSFDADPDTGDVKIIENRDCVRNSLFRIISLNKLDIPFNVMAHSKLKELLFEIPSHSIDAAIRTNLEWIITELEPRVRLDNIEIDYNEVDNKYTIDVYYTILRTNTQDVVTKEVERVR